ncbi:PfkB family carbohydrate kinase [Leifsonia xyli]|uniref:PfkB family carbohydrate kinase n=1 Tax=Leifsonia xyli TaxID=1575 RepID=UPI002691845B
MSTVRVLGLGDNIVDRFVDRGVEYPGGNAVNVAVFARQLGAEAAYLGVFGDDEQGRFVRAAIEDCGVDTSRSSVRPGPNGITEIETVDGERRFLGWNQGGVTISDPVRLSEEDLRYISGFSLVHSSAYSGIIPELPKLASTRVLRSYDFSSEPEYRTTEYLDAVGPWIDLALVSLGGSPARTLGPSSDASHRTGRRSCWGPRGMTVRCCSTATRTTTPTRRRCQGRSWTRWDAATRT